MSKESSELRQSLERRSEMNGENELNSNNMLDITVLLMNESSVSLKTSEKPNSLTANEVLNKVLSEDNNNQKMKFNFDEKFKKLFSIWITSPYLELQLQPTHRPFNLLAKWDSLLKKHGPTELLTDPTLIEKDEPNLTLQRNVFCDQTIEREIEETDIGALYLLYFEAKMNVLDGRYPTNCEEPKTDDNLESNDNRVELLAAYQSLIDLGPNNKTDYSVEYFRQHLKEYIPFNYLKSSNGLIRTLSRSTPSIRCAQKIHDKYKDLKNQKLSEYKLLKSYLEICWKNPCYGSAYFSAQIEKPIKSRIDSIVSHFDLEVWVAINEKGLHLISKEKPELLLSVDHMDLIWAVGCPKSSDPNCIPCIFIQMMGENEILQIFSRQYQLIESLLNSFIKETKKLLNSRNNSISNSNRNSNGESYDVTDGHIPRPQVSKPLESSKPVYSRQISQNSKVYKPERLSLAKFNSEGKCTNKTGSWLRVLKDKN